MSSRRNARKSVDRCAEAPSRRSGARHCGTSPLPSGRALPKIQGRSLRAVRCPGPPAREMLSRRLPSVNKERLFCKRLKRQVHATCAPGMLLNIHPPNRIYASSTSCRERKNMQNRPAIHTAPPPTLHNDILLLLHTGISWSSSFGLLRAQSGPARSWAPAKDRAPTLTNHVESSLWPNSYTSATSPGKAFTLAAYTPVRPVRP